MKANYKEYFNKVYGCYLGKCICGTMGAPYEGMKQFLDLEYDNILINTMLPNDDLDLQVLWLEVLENRGFYFTSEHLAEIFYYKCDYSPGEYAYFKKNYEKGILPPYSGKYNNQFYADGMGCPIRSEIWACVSAYDPDTASILVEKDGVLDHSNNSVEAEKYLAAMESTAFAQSDIKKLIISCKKYISTSKKLLSLIDDVVDWCDVTEDYKIIRSRIIRKYGHPDCTNLYQNVGIIVMALLLGDKDIVKTTMIAINCGYDTDCTAATVGSILGIILGGKKILDIFNKDDIVYKLGVNTTRKDYSVKTLAKDICNIGINFSKDKLIKTEFTNVIEYNKLHIIKEPITISVNYQGKPILQPQIEKDVILYIRNNSKTPTLYEIDIKSEDNDVEILSNNSIYVLKDETKELKVNIKLKNNVKILKEKYIVYFYFIDNNMKIKFRLGFNGGVKYKVYGPFWENHVNIPKLNVGDNYYKYLNSNDEIRNYHLSVKSDFNIDYINIKKVFEENCKKEYSTVIIYEDMFKISDLIGYIGPCVIYLERDIYCKDDLECMLYIGKSDKLELWLNSQKIVKDESICYYTGENIHIKKLNLVKGLNKMIVKLARTSHESYFSFNFIEKGKILDFPNHITDFSTLM